MLGEQDKKIIITWCFLLYRLQAIKIWPHKEIAMFHDKCNNLDTNTTENHLVLLGARVSRKES